MRSGSTTWTGRALPQLLVLLLASVVVLSGPSSSLAQQLPGAARVVTENGRVSIDHSGDLWALTPGAAVNPGQVVVTGADGYAQLELADHSLIEVFPNSRMVFHPSRMNLRDLVDIYLGKIRLQIQHIMEGDTPYHVTSPTAVISIRGTVLDVEVGPTDETTIEVETGVIGVRHRLLPGKEVTVETGQTLRVVPNIPLAANKGTSPLVVAGRAARIAVETLARMSSPGGKSSGGAAGAPKPPTTASTGGAGTSAGTNEPAPVPGQDGNNKGGTTATGGTGGSSGPPGDVIKP